MLKTGEALSIIYLPPIAQTQLKIYAEASGDFNPIHQDEAEAKKVGLRGVIAHGMLSAAMLAERGRVLAKTQAESFKPISFHCRFKSMLALGDTISICGTVKEVSENSLTLDLVAKNQKGETVTTATIRYLNWLRPAVALK